MNVWILLTRAYDPLSSVAAMISILLDYYYTAIRVWYYYDIK